MNARHALCRRDDSTNAARRASWPPYRRLVEEAASRARQEIAFVCLDVGREHFDPTSGWTSTPPSFCRFLDGLRREGWTNVEIRQWMREKSALCRFSGCRRRRRTPHHLPTPRARERSAAGCVTQGSSTRVSRAARTPSATTAASLCARCARRSGPPPAGAVSERQR